MARVDHWVKNVFVLPGILVALSIEPHRIHSLSWLNLIVGLAAVCLVSSSNYVLNELLDAASDRFHPAKSQRAAASGGVNRMLGYAEWLALLAAGLALSRQISTPLTLVLIGLWAMGCLYNIPPVRTKDVPYLDVLSEAINNPLRMMAGWYMTGTEAIPITTLLISYWMIGCYFMALKRFSELNELHKSGDHAVAGAYRASFKRYTPESLLVSVLFYASTAMLFLGAFIIRYRMELILGFPLVALTMAIYLKTAFKAESAVQNPEKLYREPLLMASFTATVLVLGILLFVRLPRLENFFTPTLPQNTAAPANPGARLLLPSHTHPLPSA